MKGFAFPMRFGPLGHLARAEGTALYRDRITALALRRLSESAFRESVGVGITHALFANLSPALATVLASQIEDAISRFEPNVSVLSVRVAPVGADNVLRILVGFVVKATGEESTATIETEL
jgi:phage baseplate assembly protein W